MSCYNRSEPQCTLMLLLGVTKPKCLVSNTEVLIRESLIQGTSIIQGIKMLETCTGTFSLLVQEQSRIVIIMPACMILCKEKCSWMWVWLHPAISWTISYERWFGMCLARRYFIAAWPELPHWWWAFDSRFFLICTWRMLLYPWKWVEGLYSMDFRRYQLKW